MYQENRKSDSRSGRSPADKKRDETHTAARSQTNRQTKNPQRDGHSFLSPYESPFARHGFLCEPGNASSRARSLFPPPPPGALPPVSA